MSGAEIGLYGNICRVGSCTGNLPCESQSSRCPYIFIRFRGVGAAGAVGVSLAGSGGVRDLEGEHNSSSGPWGSERGRTPHGPSPVLPGCAPMGITWDVP